MARILIVDDNRDIADSLAALLSSFGYDVCVAYDGHQALSEFSRSMPATVLLDIGLPLIDGIEVARRLRKSYGNSLRLVACTAYADAPTRQRVSQAGFDDILIKPVSITQIVEAIGDDCR